MVEFCCFAPDYNPSITKGDTMLSNKVQAIVLAAGRSSRFNTNRTKLLEKICGQEMILYITQVLEHLSIATTLVVGYQKELIQELVIKKHGSSIKFIAQQEPRGTGDALLCTKNTWEREYVLVMNGDMPLISSDIIKKLYEKHISTQADISFVIAHNPDASIGGYGRIVKNDKSIAIVEARDFEGDANEHCCVNAGIYLASKQFLLETINAISLNEKTHEFYITDLIKIASDQQRTITTVPAPFDYVRGINNFQELWAAEHIKRAEIIKHWMERGVHFSVAHNIQIDLEVTIGSGSYIGGGVHLLAGTQIGKNVQIHEFSSIQNSTIADDATIYAHSIIKDSHIGSHTQIGPFAHIREHTVVEEGAAIGNFVEIKQSIIGKQTKAKHLSYIGDARVGINANIGAGTITCNYNGASKNQTIIKDNAFVGSNNTLVAPVTIGENAFTAAGSVITEDVPPEALAIGRTRQVNKEGYAAKLRQKPSEADRMVIDESTNSFSFLGAVKTKNNNQST